MDTIRPSYIPGLREIGQNWPLNTWGGLYPRTGWTIQHSEPKSAAITAQRVGEIITRVGEPHIYTPVTGPAVDGNKITWPPFGLIENTYRQGYWQMLFPVDSPVCEVFGQNDTVLPAGWGAGRVSDTGNYAFTLWRPYTCCKGRQADIGFGS